MINLELPVGKRTVKYRFFEMLPATLSMLLILFPVLLSLISPLLASIFIIGYVISWLVKAMGIAYRTIQGYDILNKAKRLDWRQHLNDLENPEVALKRIGDSDNNAWGHKAHVSVLREITSGKKGYFKPSELLNAVIVTIYNESWDVLDPTVKSLFDSNYNMKQVILIVAYEERGPESSRKVAHDLVEKYGKRCFYSIALEHPDGIPNEVVGKGGNITNAGKFLQKFVKERGIDPEKVLVTTLDADNRPHPNYLANISYEYIKDPRRDHRAYQPTALYLNNIWDAPAPMRVLATGNSFWTIISSMRQHTLRNFSSHSQGLASLNHTNLWSVRTIVEDGHQYWRSWFAFEGDYEVVPIYVPIYQDAVLSDNYKKTIKSQFLQMRRWAYGASDVAYVADKGFGKDSPTRFDATMARFLRLLDNHISWAAAPLLITFGAWIPLFVNQDSQHSIVAHELPQMASQLMFMSMFGLFITIFLTFKLLPPRPERYKRRRNILMIAQWVFMPITSIIFGSLGAFNAQFHLFFGKYLERFDVTDKAVKK